MGPNKGFENEKNLIDSINNKSLNEIDSNLIILLKKFFPDCNLEGMNFSCYKNEGSGLEKKTDITIVAGQNKTINISLKSGKGPHSVHEENIWSFLSFLEASTPNFDDSLKKIVLKFHWCDGTLDNSGQVKDREGKRAFIKKFPEEFKLYEEFFETIKHIIFDRVMLGTINIPDFLVYINRKGEYLSTSMKKIKERHIDLQNSWGLFSLQNCWACLKGQDHGHKSHVCDPSCPKIKPKQQKHRQDIQFKWSNIESFFE